VNEETQEVKDTVILFPGSQTITIGDKTFTVQTFKLGKTLRVLEYLSEAFEIVDLAEIAAAAEDGKLNLVRELAERLPSLSKVGRTVLPKVFALTLIPDRRLAEIDENDEDYEQEIKGMVRFLNEYMPPEMAIDLLAIAINGMGLSQIRKNFPKLLQTLGSM
jgi:hypothetical protein